MHLAEEKKTLRWADASRTKEGKQREAEERAQILRKERLMREIELGALNTKRYRTLWREMMIRIKMPQIAEDVEIAWRNFDRAIDMKDYRISFLMDALDEAEEQYQKNVRSHTENLDRLLKVYRDRMDCAEENYQKILNETLNEMSTEVKKINQRQSENEILLQSITNSVQHQMEDSLNNVKSITLSKIDEFVEHSKDIRRISAAQLENQLQSSWEDLRQVLSDYQNTTKDRRNYYEVIKEKDEKDQKIIAKQLTRTTNLFDEIHKFREKISTYNASAKKKISDILMEHDFFYNIYWTVKNRFISEQMKDNDQLKMLSIEYNKTVKRLEHLVTKGKQLLTLMQICRKYETQEEKIIPFVNPMGLYEDVLTPVSDCASILPEWDVSIQIAEEFGDLTNFWRRLGAAQLITMELRLEKNKLKREANYLHKSLNSYMQT